MKHLKRYKIFESVNSDEFVEIDSSIKDMLHDITDSGLYLTYRSNERASRKRFDITISSYEAEGESSSTENIFFNWNDISPTIRRIESYLKELDRYYLAWSIYVSGVLVQRGDKFILEYLEKTNPSAIDFEVEIELYTHEEWKKLWDSH